MITETRPTVADANLDAAKQHAEARLDATR